MSSFSDRLKEERNRKELTLPVFADLAGTSRGSQINYESGLRSPNSNYLMALYAGGVDINYLLTGVRAPKIINEDNAGYDAELISDKKKLLNNLALCSKEDQQAIQRMAAYAAQANDKKKVQEKIELQKLKGKENE